MDDEGTAAEIDEFAMFQARALGAESEYLLLKQASRLHHQQGAAVPRSSPRPGTIHLGKERNSIYVAPFYILCIYLNAQTRITQFYMQIHHACLSFVSVHQMAPPLTQVLDIQLPLTIHLSNPKG